jgi:hypothetical protein
MRMKNTGLSIELSGEASASHIISWKYQQFEIVQYELAGEN